MVIRLFNTRQTNAHTFCLLGGTDMKQRFTNSYCFGDHDAIKVLLLAPSFIEKEVLKKIPKYFNQWHCIHKSGGNRGYFTRLHMKLQIVTINYSYMYNNYDMNITMRVQLWGKGEVIIQTL